MDQKIENMIREYQCPGCIGGKFDVDSCYEKGDGVDCGRHTVGTVSSLSGLIFLGMPKGFCRLGSCKVTRISIFEKVEHGWGYSMFNVPVWKYLDSNGNTLVRGLCPRTNYPWIHIFMGDQMAKIDCMIITQKDIDETMD